MLTNVKKLYEKKRSSAVILRVVESLELRQKLRKLTEKVKMKTLKLQTTSGLVEEIATLWDEFADPRKVAKKFGANHAVVSAFEIEVLEVKEAIP